MNVNSISPRKIKMFYHQNHVKLISRDSDYVFNVFSAFFNILWKSLEEGILDKRLRGITSLNEWDFQEITEKFRKKYVLINKKRNIILYRYSRQKDAPVMIIFNPVAFSTADNIKMPEKNIATIQKSQTNPKLCWVNLNFAGHPLRYLEFLDQLKNLAHKDIDFSTAEIRFIRTEIYVRYNYEREPDVCRMLEGAYIRLGEWDSRFRNNHHGEVISSVIFNYRVKMFIDDIVFHIKTYRRKNYNHPPRTLEDNPKLELTVYYPKNATLFEVDYYLNKGKEILASFVYACNLEEDLIEDYDTYPSTYGEPDPLLINAFLRGYYEFTMNQSVDLGEFSRIERKLIERLLYGNIKSEELRKIAKELGVSVRHIQYNLKRLREKGIIRKYKLKKNRHIYVLNLSNLRKIAKKQLNIDELIEEYKVLEGIPTKIRNNEKALLTYALLFEGYKTVKALSRVLNVSERQVRKYLDILQKYNLVRKIKVGRTYVYRPISFSY